MGTIRATSGRDSQAAEAKEAKARPMASTP